MSDSAEDILKDKNEVEHEKKEDKEEASQVVGEQSAAKKKKKKKKKKGGAAAGGSSSSEVPVALPAGIVPVAEVKPAIDEDAVHALRQQTKEAKGESHKFWDTQPVPRIEEEVTVINSEIEAAKPLEEVQKEPYSLGPTFEWCTVDVDDGPQLQEVYDLLYQNYVEDDDNMFRFDYSKEFLLWALKPPGFLRQWHLGVRVISNKKLVGFISAIPANLRIYEKVVHLVEINFLCVHKKLRAKRMAPLLIKEITRLVHLTNTWQAVYTAGRLLPRPISISKYYHRSLNPKKLIEVGFSQMHARMTMQRMLRLYAVPSETVTPGVRPMEAGDVKAVTVLLQAYLSKFHCAPSFDEAEVAHWFLPRENIINSFVVQDPETKVITDFISFYTLPSTVIGNAKYNTLKAAYSFYNVSTKTPWVQLMNDALILAKQRDYDVFNALDLMDNEQFIHELKFGIGDGRLHYYLYNWRCPTIASKNLGLILM